MTATVTTTIECEAAASDDVLQAARAALAPHLAHARSRWAPEAQLMNSLPEKQRPLVPLLMALLDSTERVAKAIADNAHDDSRPLAKALADELAKQATNIADAIGDAKDAPDCTDWSFPSMSGKELV